MMRLFTRKRLRNQRGASDTDALVILGIAVAGLSIVYIVMGWIRSTKEERIENRRAAYLEEHKPKEKPKKRELSGYQVNY